MARLSKKEELGRIVAGLKTFCYNVKSDYYNIPITVIAFDEIEAESLIKNEYPDGNAVEVFRGIRCLVAGIDKKL